MRKTKAKTITAWMYKILENYAFPETNLQFDDLVDKSYQHFFNFDFPWYTDDGDSKMQFEKMFLKRYMYKQIGFESVQMFKMYLSSHLERNMYTWTQIYKTIVADYGVLDGYSQTTETNETRTGQKNSDYRRTTDGERKHTGTVQTTDSGNQTTDTQSIDSENPQSTVANTDYASSMNRGQSRVETAGNNNVTNNLTDTDNTTETNVGTDSTQDTGNTKTTVTGYGNKTGAELAMLYRDAIYNLNNAIIESCADLFLGVW